MGKSIGDNKSVTSKLLNKTSKFVKLIRSSRYDKVTMGYKGVQGTANKHTRMRALMSVNLVGHYSD